MSWTLGVLLALSVGVFSVAVAACSSESSAPVSVTLPTVSSTSLTTTTALDPALVVGSGSPLGLVAPDLPGRFPTTLDAGDQVLHLQWVARELTSVGVWGDFWQQPSTGRFRRASSSPGTMWGDYLQVFTGERLQWYSATSNEALDFAYDAYKASILEDKVDPFASDQGEIGEPVTELQQAIAKGLLHETGRGEVNGREIVRYEGKFSADLPFSRVVLADSGTGFPLDDRMFRSDGVLYSCRLADLEVVEEPDLDALFSLAFPAGVKPMMVEQFTQEPEQAVGLAACLEELAKLSTEVSFPLYYLGESINGLALDKVEPANKTDGVWTHVAIDYGHPSPTDWSTILVYLHDPNLLPEINKRFEGWKLIRTVEVDGHADAIYNPGVGGLWYVATRDGTEIAIALPGDSGPAAEETLIQAAKNLRPFAPRAP